MRRVLTISLVAAAAVVGLTVRGHGQANEGLKTFMRVKLTHSQKVLEGLVEEDFQKIAKNSQELSLLSLAATWQVLNTPEYLKASREFRAAADKMTESAKKKNLGETTKAFNAVTTQCVECHKYLRDVKYAVLDR